MLVVELNLFLAELELGRGAGGGEVEADSTSARVGARNPRLKFYSRFFYPGLEESLLSPSQNFFKKKQKPKRKHTGDETDIGPTSVPELELAEETEAHWEAWGPGSSTPYGSASNVS